MCKLSKWREHKFYISIIILQRKAILRLNLIQRKHKKSKRKKWKMYVYSITNLFGN